MFSKKVEHVGSFANKVLLRVEFTETGRQGELAPLYLLLANIQMIRARRAPKMILDDARALSLSLSFTRRYI